MRQARTWAVWGAVIAAVALSGCADSASPRPARTPSPRLEAAGPPCQLVDWAPWRNADTTCLEVVLDAVSPPEAAPALMGLALGPDGTLYLARTAEGAIWAMGDADGDQFLDAPRPVAEGLIYPTSLTMHDGALYVASVGGLLRLDPAADGRFAAPVVLVPDLLDAERGFWPGSVQVGPD